MSEPATEAAASASPPVAEPVAPNGPAWRRWLLGNSRAIGLVALIVIGAALIVRGAHDLIA